MALAVASSSAALIVAVVALLVAVDRRRAAPSGRRPVWREVAPIQALFLRQGRSSMVSSLDPAKPRSGAGHGAVTAVETIMTAVQEPAEAP